MVYPPIHPSTNPAVHSQELKIANCNTQNNIAIKTTNMALLFKPKVYPDSRPRHVKADVSFQQ